MKKVSDMKEELKKQELFVATVRYDKDMENGLVKTVSEDYLIDAMSFTEAEARATEEMAACTENFVIQKIAKPRISEFVDTPDAGAEKFYRVKVSFSTLDEKSGMEKKTMQNVIVRARDFDDARRRFGELMRGSTYDFCISAITETNIVEFIPYKECV